MSTFRLVKRVPRIVYDEVVVAETDDWMEAERLVATHHRQLRGPNQMVQALPEIRGVHPTHNFVQGKGARCQNEGCGAWNNGSYGSHAPCGFDFEGKSLVQVLEEAKPG